MFDVNYLAVALAAMLAVVAASGYYIVLSKQYQRLSAAARETAATRPPLWLMPVELVKHLVVAATFAVLAGTANWVGAATLGLLLWIGFPVVILVSSVIHEKVPWRLAALHAGDWLIKLQLIALVVAVWH